MKLIKSVPYEFCVDCGCKHLKNNKCTLEGEYCNEGREKCEDCIVGRTCYGCVITENDQSFRDRHNDEEIELAKMWNFCPICGFKTVE